MTTARLAVAVSALVTISSQVLRKLVFNVRIGLTREGLIFPVTGAVCNLVLCGKNLVWNSWRWSTDPLVSEAINVKGIIKNSRIFLV